MGGAGVGGEAALEFAVGGDGLGGHAEGIGVEGGELPAGVGIVGFEFDEAAEGKDGGVAFVEGGRGAGEVEEDEGVVGFEGLGAGK